MKVSLTISLFIHIILLVAVQNIFPEYWQNSELRTYMIEFIRPPVEDLSEVDISGASLDNLKNLEKLDINKDQDTISLDTIDKRYSSYTQVIKKWIMQQWKYPPEARVYLIEGGLMILFTLTSDGELLNIDITESSGHKILDQEVIRAINKSVPFPPFPDSIKVKRLNIIARFDYRLAPKKQ